MANITIIGGGTVADLCGEVLSREGFGVRRTSRRDPPDGTPLLLGEVAGPWQVARQAVASGRHLLITNPQTLTTQQLAALFRSRKRSQALCLWSGRRYHPAYRFLSGLVGMDETWRPRFLRSEWLSVEAPSSSVDRWRLLESFALLGDLISEQPLGVTASAIDHEKRHTPEAMSVHLSYESVQAFVLMGSAEPIERRETLLATVQRKVWVDELDAASPIRMASDPGQGEVRGLAYPEANEPEQMRQQCLAFLESTTHSRVAYREAELWRQALAMLAATERAAFEQSRASVAIEPEAPRLRLIHGRRPGPPSAALARRFLFPAVQVHPRQRNPFV